MFQVHINRFLVYLCIYSPRFPVNENSPPLQAEGFPCYHCLPLHWLISKWKPGLFLSHTDKQTRPPRCRGRQQTEYMGGQLGLPRLASSGAPAPKGVSQEVGHCRAVGERRLLRFRRTRAPAGKTHDTRESRLGVSNHRLVCIQMIGFRARAVKASGSQPRLRPRPRLGLSLQSHTGLFPCSALGQVLLSPEAPPPSGPPLHPEAPPPDRSSSPA